MLFYLLSDKQLSEGCNVEIPQNIVLFQEFSSAHEEQQTTGTSAIYKVIVDIQIHDPLVLTQTNHVYTPMKNNRYPDHETDDGIFRFELMEKIMNTQSSREIFSTVAILEQIRHFGFGAVYIFEDYRREIIIINKCIGKIIGTVIAEKSSF